MSPVFAPDAVLRLPFYAVFGMITEVLFTGVSDLIAPSFLHSWKAKNLRDVPPQLTRDPRAVGYTFLWMAPLYALLVIVEPLSFLVGGWPWFLRGLVYLAAFWMGEYTTGALIKKITGYCPWDYSYSPFSLHGYIRWDFGPLWFAFTLALENFSQKLVLLTPALKSVVMGG